MESDDDMNESIDHDCNKISGCEEYGVKFKTWLARDPKTPLTNQKYDFHLSTFWERNFYPDIYTLANDLYEKGLIEKGEYIVEIDW